MKLFNFTTDDNGPFQCLKCMTVAQQVPSKIDDGYYLLCPQCFNHEAVHGENCCRNYELQYVRVEIAGGKHQLRKSCKGCGTVEGGALKHSLVADISQVPIVKEPESRWKKKSEERDVFRAWADNKRDTIWRKRYEAHLSSPEWQRLRHLVLQRDNHMCQGCLLVRASEVHHKTYEHLGCEFAFELISLCSSCHKNLHDASRSNL